MSEEVGKKIEAFLGAVETSLGRLFKPTAAPAREPVEHRMEAVREIAGQVQPTGRGGYYFPHEQVKVILHDASLKTAFANPHFESDVRAELKERGCDRAAIPVTIDFLEQPGALYEIEFPEARRVESTVTRPAASLHLVQGKADIEELAISKDRVFIGRLAEVRFKDGRLSRRNDFAFDETETTVARKHAWIQYDAASGKFRVFNDPECELGTHVYRDGATIPSDSARGVQLKDGDEIHLGNARLRFTIENLESGL
jgi:hypothetical protein